MNGREADVRSHPTNLTKLIVSAMLAAAPKADIALLNSGSIRVDDVLPMPITEYDIIRTLPFGGGIREAEMKGSLVMAALTQGQKNIGSGGYLAYNENITHEAGTWKLNGIAIDPEKVYRVAITDFLFSGKEANLAFLNPDDPGVIKTFPTPAATNPLRDIRLAVIRFLEKNK
jgi:2',3'-cyclic-nucleotide 2'-phosphodiesterase (5'-nucleotidase family)